MQTLLSSPARLRDRATVDALRDLFLFHGVLGHRIVPPRSQFSEVDRLQIVPMVFGLLPRRVLFRDQSLILVKPLIREHLANVGVQYDEEVVDVLKSVGDQYFNTDPVAGPAWYRRGKWGIGDLKAANRQLYVSMRREQQDRCSTCGVVLDNAYETLDHCIPWRFIGDVMDGSNWQLLCAACNAGKREFLSTLQSVQSLNWIYGQPRSMLATASNESRYAVLAQRPRCEVVGCSATAHSARLQIVTLLDTGLPVADNLTVRCEAHAA